MPLIAGLAGIGLAGVVLAAPLSLVAQQPAAALLHPESLSQRAPDTFTTILDTSVGIITVRVTRAWAPLGADRFHSLVKNGFYDGARVFRVLPKFMAQFGLHGDPGVSAAWKDQTMPSDRPLVSNTYQPSPSQVRRSSPSGRARTSKHDR